MKRCRTIERRITRRDLIFPIILALSMALAFVQEARARDIVDATGRTVTIPDAPARVFAAGPPASVLLYALAPETMVGWTRAPRAADLPFLLPATHELPELGRLTGRGGTVNLEVLLAIKPDLIVDFGTVNPSYIDLANSIAEQTGIPYILIDGSFDNTPAAIRALAEALGVPARGEALAEYAEATLARVDAVLADLPDEDRPRVYLARGPEGLETPARGSINAEIVERVGGTNVAVGETRGLMTPSLEQIIAWAPDTILTIDRDFAAQAALLQKSGLRREGLFPLPVQATRTISAVPRALKRLMSTTRMWISAVWRSGVSHWSAIGPSDNGEPRRCALRRTLGLASLPRRDFGRGIRSTASRTPCRSGAWRAGFVAGRGGRAVLLPRSTVFPDRDDRHGAARDDGACHAISLSSQISSDPRFLRAAL